MPAAMLNLKSLKEEMDQKLALLETAAGEMEKLQGKTDAPEADVTAAKEVYDSLTKEFDALEGKVKEAEAHQKRVAMRNRISELAEPKDDDTASAIRGGVPSEPAQAKNHDADLQAHRDAFMKWIKGKNLSEGDHKILTPRSEKLRNSEDEDAKASVRLPDNLVGQIMGANFNRAFGKTVTTINNALTNPSLANLLVSQEYIAQLQMLPFDAPVILDFVTIMPCETGNLTFPSLVQTNANEFGGMSWTWTTEAAEKGETEPRFSQIEIPTYELSGYTEVSERALSRSAISIEALLMVLVRAGMRFTVDAAVMSGNGTTQPLGIVNTAGIRTVARQAVGAVGDTDLVNLKHEVKAAHRGGARYILEDDVEEGLEEATDTQGRPLFRASTANGPYDRLVGYPYNVSENSPELGSAGDVMFGNPKWYILAMEEEITIAKSAHYRFRNNVVAFKFFTVVGGRLMQPRAFSILGEGTS